MATLNELYSELLLDISPSISDDTSVDERLLKAFIHKVRAVFARNEMDKSHRTIDAALIQDLGLVELETVDSFVDTGLDNISHTILRTVKSIPRALELHNKQAFTYIGSVDTVSKSFKIVDITSVPYMGNGKFGKSFKFAYLMNDKIHIIGNCNDTSMKGLKYINIKGVFENPEDASKFNKPDGTPCYSDNEEYPLPLYMWAYMKKEIINSDLRQFYIPIEDPLNNSNNDINRFNSNINPDSNRRYNKNRRGVENEEDKD